MDVVRLALHEPSAIARTKQEEPEDEDRAAGGVVVDISRKRVLIDGESAAFTFKEFELLQYLVLREGRTIERTELVNSLWQGATEEEAPGERTIDVHVRRLRAKLGRYEDIVRTVRGVGYRFDRHADVVDPLRPRHAVARPLLSRAPRSRARTARAWHDIAGTHAATAALRAHPTPARDRRATADVGGARVG